MEARYFILLVTIGLGLFLLILERIFPDQKLLPVSGWWTRVIIINIMQLGVVFTAGRTWEIWFDSYSLIDLHTGLAPAIDALIAYLVVTFIFYWWHRFRHDSNFLWRVFHQIHHSPSRIETITSFYKHPAEIMMNSLFISFVIFFCCGFSIEVGMWLTLYTAVGEYIYHMNIRTPHFMGYFFQRPEMHRVHHQQGKHYNNFSDLPLWDMLFGTFENPVIQNHPCGFEQGQEQNGFWKMLRFKSIEDE